MDMREPEPGEYTLEIVCEKQNSRYRFQLRRASVGVVRPEYSETLTGALQSAKWKLIPVFWGDLGGKSQDIQDCLPVLRDGQWTVRAGEAALPTPIRDDLGSGRLTNAERAAIIVNAAPEATVRAPVGTGSDALADMGRDRQARTWLRYRLAALSSYWFGRSYNDFQEEQVYELQEVRALLFLRFR
ncbi:MAG: hypothetical protein ICV83_14555 [Cytophagales bacterium]|nr:hypothetical protein [Cytophagales bacterium]